MANNAGNQLSTMLVAIQPGTQAGPVDVWLKDLVILHSDGSVTPIVTANQVSLTPVQEPGSLPALSTTPLNVSAGTGLTLDYAPTPVETAESATYYLDDHLGTTQMEVSAGGWTVWQGQFTPFGQELDNGLTAMHYKFTGKERDAETGLDYFGARYYASTLGRWMSPDWADKPEAVPYSSLDNPQSLNLYGYVGNNPLSRADADGHNWLNKLGNLFTWAECWCEGATASAAAAKNKAAAQARENQMEAHAAAVYRQAHPGQPVPVYKVSFTILYPTGFGELGALGAVEGDLAEGAEGAEAGEAAEGSSKTAHGQQRADEAAAGDTGRQVGDPNRVIREGKQYIDADTGNTVHVNGDRIVITNSEGREVTQFTNSRANTLKRVESGRWLPK